MPNLNSLATHSDNPFITQWTSLKNICQSAIQLNGNNKEEFVAQFFLRPTNTCQNARYFRPLDAYLSQWDLMVPGGLKKQIKTYLIDETKLWDEIKLLPVTQNNPVAKPNVFSLPLIDLATIYGDKFDAEKFQTLIGQEIVEILQPKIEDLLKKETDSEGKIKVSREEFNLAKGIANLMIFWLPVNHKDRVRLKNFLDRTETLYHATAATSR